VEPLDMRYQAEPGNEKRDNEIQRDFFFEYELAHRKI